MADKRQISKSKHILAYPMQFKKSESLRKMKCCKNETIRDYISNLGQPVLCSETNLRAGGKEREERRREK